MMRDSAFQLGHRRRGAGRHAVIVLHDWLGDTTTWAATEPYLPLDISWIFVDLRGYGRSRSAAGPYDLTRSVEDVRDLAGYLGLGPYTLVGHSMSCLVALRLAQLEPAHLQQLVLLTPPPPFGGAGDQLLTSARDLALADDATRSVRLGQMWGDRLNGAWLAYKVRAWRAAARTRAAHDYVEMFARDGLPDARPIAIPVWALTGEADQVFMRRQSVLEQLGPLCPSLDVTAFEECGHYPMQEAPPRMATWLTQRIRALGPVA